MGLTYCAAAWHGIQRRFVSIEIPAGYRGDSENSCLTSEREHLRDEGLFRYADSIDEIFAPTVNRVANLKLIITIPGNPVE